MPRVQANSEIAIADDFLDKICFSAKYATLGSNNEIEELKAAIVSNIKNIGPRKFPNSIWLKAVSIEINTKPGPLFGSMLKAKIIGKIANPASMATKVSRDPTLKDVETIFSSFGIYAPYAIIEPIPRLKLKKAWPIALKKVCEFTWSKSGANKNSIALLKSPFIAELITIKINKNPSIGIKILTILSIPDLIPRDTMKAVRNINNECQNNKLYGELVTSLNFSAEFTISDDWAAINI